MKVGFGMIGFLPFVDLPSSVLGVRCLMFKPGVVVYRLLGALPLGTRTGKRKRKERAWKEAEQEDKRKTERDEN